MSVVAAIERLLAVVGERLDKSAPVVFAGEEWEKFLAAIGEAPLTPPHADQGKPTASQEEPPVASPEEPPAEEPEAT